jgi:iron complex outermembrane receptor protein
MRQQVFSSRVRLDDYDSKDYSLQTNIVGKFATGPVKHTLLFGVDLNRNNSSTLIKANFSKLAPLMFQSSLQKGF